MSTVPDNFADLYYGTITDEVVARMQVDEKSPPQFDVREYEGDLGADAAVAGLISRVGLRPAFLVRVTAGQASDHDSTQTAYKERVQIEVLCCVSNPRSLTEQKRTGMGAMGYARRLLSGFRLEGVSFAASAIVYDSWEEVTNGPGLCVISANFYLDTNVEA